MAEALHVARAGGVARVVLDRPPLNILDAALVEALGAAFRALPADPDLRVAVLSGRGRAFSAGVDLRLLRDLDADGARRFIGSLHETVRALRELPVPVVARLHGPVLGGALELALGADLRLAGTSGQLGLPEVRVGIPSVIEAALLPGLVGWGRAAELLLTGEILEAREAERWGLVTRVVEDERLDAEVEAWVERLAALPPGAVRLQKALLARWRQVDLDTAIAMSVDAFVGAYATGEPRAGAEAFLRRPRSLDGRAPAP